MDERMVAGIFIVLCCVVLSAFFSGTETTLTSLSSLKTKHLLEHSGKRGQILDLWIKHPQRILAAILIGNTLVNTYAAVYIEQLSSELSFKIRPEVLTAGITTVIVLFAEIIPKTVAKTYPSKLAIPAIYIFRPFYAALWIPTMAASWIAHVFTRVFIQKTTKADPNITVEELEFMINASEEEGVLEEQKHEMLSAVFELGDTVVREIMVHRIDMTALSKSTRILEAADVLHSTGLSRIPIYEGNIDNIIGILHVKDVLWFLKKHRDEAQYWESTVDLLKRDALFTPESKPIDLLFQDLRKQRRHIAIVLDEYGGTSGIVTMEDIFEEIVGEVRDEFDNEEDAIRPTQNPNRYLVECKIHIDDFCDFFDLDIDDIMGEHEANEFDTLGGLILCNFGQIPKVGDSLTIGRLSLEIAEVSKRRVRRAIAQIADPNQENINENSQLIGEK